MVTDGVLKCLREALSSTTGVTAPVLRIFFFKVGDEIYSVAIPPESNLENRIGKNGHIAQPNTLFLGAISLQAVTADSEPKFPGPTGPRDVDTIRMYRIMLKAGYITEAQIQAIWDVASKRPFEPDPIRSSLPLPPGAPGFILSGGFIYVFDPLP